MHQESDLILGSAWYPEQWPQSVWQEDMMQMQAFGFNAVRLAEFAWAALEPQEGQYALDWLRDALDLLHKNNIGAILCTPTATPPIWLLKKYPEIGFVDADGYRHKHGARQHASYNNPTFRQYAKQITEVIAEAFGSHPALIAWQTDNELGSHQQRCMSEDSVKRWHQWLEQRYTTIEALNQSWRTAVWSQTYNAFDEVPPPYRLVYYTHHLSLKLNYRRFMADMVSGFQKELVDVIKKYSTAPVTHNSTSKQDDWRMSRHLDFPSSDVYTHNKTRLSMQYRFDSMRNLFPGTPYITMETAAEGQIDGELFREGWIGSFAFVNYCMGGKGLSFWPWRQQPGGAEIFHEALLHSCGEPTSGSLNAREANEVKTKLTPILKEYRPARADVAFIRSEYNGRYRFTDGSGGIEKNFDYETRILEWYKTFVDIGVWRDLIFDEATFESYPILFSPYLPWVNPELMERMIAMVEQGSTWIVGPYTGFLTEDNTIPTDAILGTLETRLQFKTKHSISAGTLNVDVLGKSGTTSQFANVFTPGETDEVIGTYTTPRFAGQAWGLKRAMGKGHIYILGSHLDADSRHNLWKSILTEAGVSATRPTDIDPKVTTIPLKHVSKETTALALCNWGYEETSIPLKDRTLLSACERAEVKDGTLHMPAQSWAVIQPSSQAR